MRRRIGLGMSILLLLGIAVLLGVSYGSVKIDFTEIWKILNGTITTGSNYRIVWEIRMPRVLGALLVGGALAVSGYLMQTFFGNPIAGPYVLGVSSGAKLTVALSLIFFLERGISVSSMGMVCAAFFGAMLSMGVVLLLSGKVHKMSYLIVCGIFIGYLCSAITEFCIAFAQDANIVNLHNWSQGSLSGMNWEKVEFMGGLIAVCLFLSFLLSKPIGAFLVGETYAKSVGVNCKRLRVMLILLSSLLASLVTAFAGPISFVGIAIPHVVKQMGKTAKPMFMLPVCFLTGATATIFFDGIARTVFAPVELSISAVTAVFLAPVVIIMMVKRQADRE